MRSLLKKIMKKIILWAIADELEKLKPAIVRPVKDPAALDALARSKRS